MDRIAGSAAALVFALAGLMTCAGAAAAASPDALAPGQYLTEHGGGTLVVTAGQGGERTFSIDFLGANLHSCQLAGTVHGRASHPDEEDGKTSACKVMFAPQAGGVAVDVDPETADACHYFCGVRAWFPGLYLAAPAACTSAARRRSDAAFSAAYQRKDYAAALAAIEPVLSACDRFLRPADDARMRNDTAVTLFHLGRDADCRAVLKPVIDRWPNDESGLRDGLPPGDFDDILPVAKAAWHNDKLCSKP